MQTNTQAHEAAPRQVQQDSLLVRWGLTTVAVVVVVVLVVIPVVHVFYQALSRGLGTYWTNLAGDADTRHALGLTLVVAACAVAVNLMFGVAAAWAIARFRFPGRALLITLIDLPFSVSPIVVGLALVLVFGMQGFLGPWLKQAGWQVLFAPPAIILA